MLGRLGRFAVDAVHLDQRKVALAILGRADFALDRVAGVQIETADLRRADVDVISGGEIGRVGRSQEPETVGQHFECAIAKDRLAFFRTILQERENELLLAHAIGAFDLVGLRHLDQGRDVQ